MTINNKAVNFTSSNSRQPNKRNLQDLLFWRIAKLTYIIVWLDANGSPSTARIEVWFFGRGMINDMIMKETTECSTKLLLSSLQGNAGRR